MKKISLLLLLFISLTCNSQNTISDSIRLTISPSVNQEDLLNQQIITTLKLFFKNERIAPTRTIRDGLNRTLKNIFLPISSLKKLKEAKQADIFINPR